jgi:hypothetical protein
VPPNGFERLGKLARRFFLHFVHAPADTLHTDWRAELLPWWVEGSRLDKHPAALSLGLLAALGVDHDMSRFRFDDPACQAALLPPDDLQALARQLGLALHAPGLMRVIGRIDVAALASQLSERDWQFIESLGPAGWPARPMPVGPVDGAGERIRQDGLLALMGLLRRLPKNIAQRALVKLPRSEAAISDRQLVQAAYLFPVVYRAFVASASDRWHELWTVPPTAALN